MSKAGTEDRPIYQFRQRSLLWVAGFYPDLQVQLHYPHQLLGMLSNTIASEREK